MPAGYFPALVLAFQDPRWSPTLRAFAETDEFIRMPSARQSILDDPRYGPVHPFMSQVGWDAAAILPLHVQGRTTGALTMYFVEAAGADAAELEFFGAIADQAAIAVENARLYSDAAARAKEQQAIARIAATLTVERSLEGVLAELAEQIAHGTRAIGAAIVVLGEEGEPATIGDFGLPDEYGRGIREARLHFPEYWDEVNAQTDVVVTTDARRAILGEPAYAPVHHLIDEVAWDTLVRVPFVLRERVRGLVALFLPAEPALTASELQLFRALADQASLAAESASLYQESVRRAREQEALAAIAATATVDQPIGQLLDAITGTIAAALGVAACSIVLSDWEGERTVAGAFGLPKGYFAAFGATVARSETVAATLRGEAPGTATVLRGTRKQFAEDPDYAPMRQFGDLAWDTVVRLQFSYHQRERGALLLYLLPDHEPTPSFFRALRAMADQAAVAVENLNLFHQLEERTHQLEALYGAEEALHRSLKFDEVVDAVFDVVIELLRADGAALILQDREGARPRVLAKSRRGPVGPEILLAVEQNLSDDPHFRAGLARSVELGRIHIASEEDLASGPVRSRTYDVGIRSLIEVTIIDSGGAVGLLNAFYSTPRTFSEAEKRVFAAVAKRASVAIDNARLYAQAESLAATQERQRLARELHDSVSQALYGIALGARTARTLLDRDATKAVEPVDYVLQLAEAGLAEMRALIFELRPESLAEQGLVVAIEKQAASMRARYGIAVAATLCDEPDVPLPMKEALYRVAQEAMHNVVKHARATAVDVALADDAGAVTLEVRDNGLGFDPDGDFPGHLGLRSMRERVTRLGGIFEVTSAANEGTAIRVVLRRTSQ